MAYWEGSLPANTTLGELLPYDIDLEALYIFRIAPMWRLKMDPPHNPHVRVRHLPHIISPDRIAPIL